MRNILKLRGTCKHMQYCETLPCSIRCHSATIVVGAVCQSCATHEGVPLARMPRVWNLNMIATDPVHVSQKTTGDLELWSAQLNISWHVAVTG